MERRMVYTWPELGLVNHTFTIGGIQKNKNNDRLRGHALRIARKRKQMIQFLYALSLYVKLILNF